MRRGAATLQPPVSTLRAVPTATSSALQSSIFDGMTVVRPERPFIDALRTARYFGGTENTAFCKGLCSALIDHR